MKRHDEIRKCESRDFFKISCLEHSLCEGGRYCVINTGLFEAGISLLRGIYKPFHIIVVSNYITAYEKTSRAKG